MFSTPWISRLAALLLLMVSIAAAYVFLAEPIILGHSEADREIEEVRSQLLHYQRLAASRLALVGQVERSAAAQTSQGYYLSGETDALAAARLQDRVNALVEQMGGSLRSIQPMPGVDEDGFRRITLRVQMTARNEAFFEILYALESGTPLLFVENLDIQSRYIRRRSRQGELEEVSDAPLLAIGFDLSGYMPSEDQ